MSQTKIQDQKLLAETFSKQYPIALQAIGLHIAQHQLPAPLSIETHLGSRSIVICLAGLSTHEAWLQSVHVDSEDNERRGDYYRTTWGVRLPDSGFRLWLRGSRPLPLQAVRG